MAVDGAELANLVLGLLKACFVDTRSPADRAMGVGEGVEVFACEGGPFRRRGWGEQRMDVRLRCILGDGQAMLEEGRIDVGDARNRDWEGTVRNGQ